MLIDCQLDFTPGRDTIDSRAKLTVSGVTAFEEYSCRLTMAQREVVMQILRAHSTAMAKAAEAFGK